jgi:hypothetical protein
LTIAAKEAGGDKESGFTLHREQNLVEPSNQKQAELSTRELITATQPFKQLVLAHYGKAETA